jgi:lipid A 3-O-deacylase
MTMASHALAQSVAPPGSPDVRPIVLRAGYLPDAGFVQAGFANNTKALTGGLQWNWGVQYPLLGGLLYGYWEASIGRWSTSEADASSYAWVTQLGVTPTLRWYPRGAAWFVEGGIGANVITPIYRSSDRHFTTAFNFGDMLGIGRRVGEDGREEVSLRLQHFSNAGIKRPNPGENFVQLRYTWRVD